jgi:hypothetical protein
MVRFKIPILASVEGVATGEEYAGMAGKGPAGADIADDALLEVLQVSAVERGGEPVGDDALVDVGAGETAVKFSGTVKEAGAPILR